VVVRSVLPRNSIRLTLCNEKTNESACCLLNQWLTKALEKNASDLHLVSGHPPVLRTHGKLTPISGEEVLSAAAIRAAVEPILAADQKALLEKERDLDFAIEVELEVRKSRFRVNVFQACGSLGACLRVIPDTIPDFSWSSFPKDLAIRLGTFANGLILFTGITGSGKSTSLAMIVEHLNRNHNQRILTIEDPIEYLFPRYENSVVTQREVGRDVLSFADGLRFGLRQDPDVILVGEIRDIETARMALSAAETGHLIFSTLHTRDAKGSISRYTDFFPQQVQNEIRSQLASGLRAVICQRLLPSNIEGEKQELALEILFNTPAVGAAIRQGKLESIDTCIVTGRSEGMVSMDESIRRLLADTRISRATAENFISDRLLLR
jgi:twitching motility protein PilT